MGSETRIVLTGFMGVGKSTVARYLADLLGCERVDLDYLIQDGERRTIADIIETDGEAKFRQIETAYLAKTLAENAARIVALGGGAWTIAENRRLIAEANLTSVWLESTFEHCWRNIRMSRRVRPLAKNKAHTRRLFNERQRFYCLADWHFIVQPELSSLETAKKIAEEVFFWSI